MNPSLPHSDPSRLAARIRRRAVEMVHSATASHIGSCLSAADILAHLYSGCLRVDPANPHWPGRDRFILSKGHAAAVLYAVLAERGFFPVEMLDSYGQDDTVLAGHCTDAVAGVEVSTGSLGHGLPIGCGMALAAKRDGRDYRVFVLLGDGECNEGSVWEAALFARQHELDNLVAIVDHNKLQGLGAVDEVLSLQPFDEKWRAFGFSTVEIDGHDHDQIARALANVPRQLGRPTAVIAHTIKGKGVSFMEGSLAWHYKSPDDSQLAQAIGELEVAL